MQKWKQTWQAQTDRAELPPLKRGPWPVWPASSCTRMLGMLRVGNRGWMRAIKPLLATLCHSNLNLWKNRLRGRLWQNFVRYLWEITVPNSHWQRVLVFSQINIGFEFRFNCLVECSIKVSQSLLFQTQLLF